MFSKILFIFFTLCILSYADIITSRESSGAQIIDSKLSYFFNLRYSPKTSKFYFRADRSDPNVFAVTVRGSSYKDFTLDTVSSISNNLNDSFLAYFAFDVINNPADNADYFVGSTLGGNQNNNEYAMNLYVSSTRRFRSPYQSYKNLYLYSPIIDSTTLGQSVVEAYFVGWKYGQSDYGLVVARATATLGGIPAIEITDLQKDVIVLQTKCYDVWNDINKPHLYLDTINGQKYLMLGITGRCDGIYRIKIDSEEFFKSNVSSYTDTLTTDANIINTAYNNETKTLYYARRRYVSQEAVTIHTMTMSQDNLAPNPKFRRLNLNESNPIMTVDTKSNSLFIAADNKIYRVNGADIITNLGVASLPAPLRAVSSMLYFINDFIYLVTWEPNAQIGRIPLKYFCSDFCGNFGYCTGDNNCECAEGYKKNEANTCALAHDVDYQVEFVTERGIAISLGVLFFIALIAAIAGWVMWWRGRKSVYSSMN